MRILIVEDHLDVADTVADYLIGRGHHVETASDGERGLQRALEGAWDALVVDRILPRMDGATIVSRLRSEAGRTTPVIMLTALRTTTDKLTGFAAGADDYLAKPFDLPELEARLLALHRRATAPVHAGHRLQVADLVFDLEAMQATRGGRVVTLNPTGRRLLAFLMRQTARVVSKTELERHLWNDAVPPGDALPVHIHALRQAIDQGYKVKLLHTVRGAGYRLAEIDGG